VIESGEASGEYMVDSESLGLEEVGEGGSSGSEHGVAMNIFECTYPAMFDVHFLTR
jgi:hypothetical protein